jgi:hypothetical protein
MARPERDIVGQTIGYWLVERVMPKRRGLPRMCGCLCTGCGERKLVKKNHLLAGETSSCGCRNVRDLTGLRVGRLRVLRLAAEKEFPHAGAAWECVCDCGGRCIVRGQYLIRSRTPVRSCGCTRQRNAARERAEPMVRCEAYRPGIYGHRRVALGEVLNVKVGSFCSSWLRHVPSTTPLGTRTETSDLPERTTGAQAALDRETDMLRPFGVSASSRRHDVDDKFFGRAITGDDVPDFMEEP